MSAPETAEALCATDGLDLSIDEMLRGRAALMGRPEDRDSGRQYHESQDRLLPGTVAYLRLRLSAVKAGRADPSAPPPG
jgi:hypothetical protein